MTNTHTKMQCTLLTPDNALKGVYRDAQFKLCIVVVAVSLRSLRDTLQVAVHINVTLHESHALSINPRRHNEELNKCHVAYLSAAVN